MFGGMFGAKSTRQMPQKEYAPKYLKTGMSQDNLMAALLARERGEDVDGLNVKVKGKAIGV